MTVKELEEYFGDRKFFPNPDQEVRFSLTPYGMPKEQEKTVELCGSTVPEANEAVVVLRPAVKRKYVFSLMFEAKPVIEATGVEEAMQKALELMEHRTVIDICTGDGDGDFVERKPEFLEEVKG